MGGSLRLSLAKLSGKDDLSKTTETVICQSFYLRVFLSELHFSSNVRKQCLLSSLVVSTPEGLLQLCCAVIWTGFVSGWGGLCCSVKLQSSSQQCLLPALRRGASRALAKHFGMEITIYICSTSASSNTKNKKRKEKKETFFLPPGRSSYLIPKDRFSVCAIFVAGSAAC